MLPDQCKLNVRDHSDLYNLIVKNLLKSNTYSENPRAVFLGGQPGAGKTKMRDLASDEIPSVLINGDDLREYHPMYESLKLSDPARASYLVNEDVSLWMKRLIRQTAEEKRNIIIDGTFGNNDQNMLADTMRSYKERGYDVELWVIAVPAEFSKLGIYLRNELQIKNTGAGRFVSMKVHDVNYKNLPANIRMAVTSKLAEKVRIFGRTVEKSEGKFVNNKVHMLCSLDKNGKDYENAADLFLKARNEPFTPELKQYYSIRLKEVKELIENRINEAMKENDKEKVNGLSHYKETFLTDMGLKNERSQELTL